SYLVLEDTTAASFAVKPTQRLPLLQKHGGMGGSHGGPRPGVLRRCRQSADTIIGCKHASTLLTSIHATAAGVGHEIPRNLPDRNRRDHGAASSYRLAQCRSTIADRTRGGNRGSR